MISIIPLNFVCKYLNNLFMRITQKSLTEIEVWGRIEIGGRMTTELFIRLEAIGMTLGLLGFLANQKELGKIGLMVILGTFLVSILGNV